jgi:hypothetical protein
MRFKSTTFFSFTLILLVGLLASKALPAQKKFSFPTIHFGTPHFKPLFNKDSTNKYFNPKHWFKYKKEQPYTKNENAMPIAVGYTDFDENVRDLQLLGKLPTDNSLTIRPYILPKSVTYDSLLKAIDPSIVNNGHLVHKKHFDIQLLPVNYLQKYNSHHPYGWNDGPLSFSKGYQYLVSGGVYMHWRNIHLTLRPEYFHTASDKYETSAEWGQVNPSLNKLILGQSSLRIDLGPIGITAGTNNMWRGPGIISSLLMTNNAQGFQHIGINTIRPLKTPLGSFELSIYGATLTKNANQGFENKYLKIADLPMKTRYINMLTFTYNPIFLKNIFFGANRVFHQNTRTIPSTNFMRDYIPVTLPLFRNVYQDNDQAIDQLISGFVKYVFPKEHAELYFEYGWNDGKSNLRDLLLDNSHSSASVLGFRKLQFLNNNSFIKLEFEATRMSQTPSYLQRNAGNWYEHGRLLEGYTNENQILGAGSGYGNNIQSFMFSYDKKIFNSYGLKIQHISSNPIGGINLFNKNGGWQDWDDFTYGIVIKQRYKNILFNANIDWVHSNNYLWQENKKRENFYFFLNTIFLW